ncbi:DUF2867 domain-containing protein [Xanthomonas vesicatoria]|nr:DUF2867 domain-containing protein [Xanthomonas vesicatoria]MCC8595246.1 DUF2867 domain-containing protein [Xanthomonas vesicatoria]MCC8603993.1 DUF2867 domain-containing protein [Xanthomonas vesicatoria]MCC8621502.1 DUF2867 domain-containing protein [Xanthomonas vesicatoria]MCC8692481.1 DUF2867 domain-containing protein [Xanthomonas vesicatoria]MCC8701112.1 DUF2867 domain-containing protein [Xanthomonas vesicatoria]
MFSTPQQRPADAHAGFPSVRLESYSGGLPVEVALIAQLGVGAGNPLIDQACRRQRAHPGFHDALDEPSARLAGTDFAQGESTALFSFAVGANGHPFHRHAGHRMFTAITGSSGAQLRFCTASMEQIEQDPQHFLAALRHIDLPADCLFTVRFGGTWHQFAPLKAQAAHPAFFALSCHSDEAGGELSDAVRARVLSGTADIATLTETLPDTVIALLASAQVRALQIPTVGLSLAAAPGSSRFAWCGRLRSLSGRLRQAFGRLRQPMGFVALAPQLAQVSVHTELKPDSLLTRHLQRFDHQDSVRLRLQPHQLRQRGAHTLMALLLEGFTQRAPRGVTWLMRLRNALVAPLQLRTSPLGCPVSSLLSEQRDCLFAGRFPVLAQDNAPLDRRVQVLLGADDRHLMFRSSVGVEVLDDGSVELSLETRVACRNRFGRVYMAFVDGVHHRYIAPALLRTAAQALLVPIHGTGVGAGHVSSGRTQPSLDLA